MVNAYTHFDGGLDDICFCEDNNRLFWPFWFDCFYYISVCLRVFNSSINFVIYCFLGESFRKEMKKMAEESREQCQKWLLKVFLKM